MFRPVWLDSGKPLSNYGRYDIICADPKFVCESICSELDECLQEISHGLDLNDKTSKSLPFIGGLMGALNYDYLHESYSLIGKSQERGHLAIYEWAIVVDHKERKTVLVMLPSLSEPTRAELVKRLSADKIPETLEYDEHYRVGEMNSNLDYERYKAALERIHQHILEGDAYQINFSHQFRGEFEGDELAAYLACRSTLPSPYSAFMPFDNRSILCLSPERFVSLNNAKARTQPIKGTVKRGASDKEDLAQSHWLMQSEKNRAENVMIVDLLRNDFNKSCEPLSVEVPALCELKSFANVHHLVSTVTGTLREDVTPIEFLLNCFPGGSITGAPKKSAMRIIDDLEQHPRGVYCGSIFYQSINGRLDSNIAIRTLEIADEHIQCSGGGGITIESTAQEEFDESIDKINILLKALRR